MNSIDRLALGGGMYVYVAFLNIYILSLGTSWLSGDTIMQRFIEIWSTGLSSMSFWTFSLSACLISYGIFSMLNRHNLQKVTWGIVIVISLPHILYLSTLVL